MNLALKANLSVANKLGAVEVGLESKVNEPPPPTGLKVFRSNRTLVVPTVPFLVD
jgi:hypothetical protein